MKRKISVWLILLLLTSASAVRAQDIDRVIHGWGWFSLDWVTGPVKEYTYVDGSGQRVNEAIQIHGYGFLGGMYAFRYNFSEPDTEKAFSFAVVPALSLGFVSNGGRLYFNLPVMAGWEFGAGSTYNSNATFGGFLRLGVEYNMLPVLKNTTVDGVSREYVTYENGRSETRTVQAQTSFLNPCIAGGFRYWSRNNVMKEIGLKIGYGFGSSSFGYYANANPLTFKLSFIRFINY